MSIITRNTRRAALLAAAAVAAAAAFPAISSAAPLVLDTPTPSTTGAPVDGDGSWIRIYHPGLGAFIPNDQSDNTGDDTYTTLYPSVAGNGLEIDNGYQSDAASSSGSGIVQPVRWSAAPGFSPFFDVFTTANDDWGPKGSGFPTPKLQVAGSTVDDLRAWTINYGTGAVTVPTGDPAADNSFHYNQGADDSGSGADQDLSVRTSGSTVLLDWTSEIHGDTIAYPTPGDDGFDGTTGRWHIEGEL